jgi:hypothetical protein
MRSEVPYATDLAAVDFLWQDQGSFAGDGLATTLLTSKFIGPSLSDGPTNIAPSGAPA